MDRYDQQQEHRRQLRLQNIDQQPDQQIAAHWDQQAPEEDPTRAESEQLHENVVLLTSEEDAGSTSADTASGRGTANVRSRVRYWLNDIVDEMRKKSPASVQKWVDSIQMPNNAGGSNVDAATGPPLGTLRLDEPDSIVSDAPGPEQLVNVTGLTEDERIQEEEDETDNQQRSVRAQQGDHQEWSGNVDHGCEELREGLDARQDGTEGGGTVEHVLTENSQRSAAPAELTDVLGGCGTTSTPKLAKLDDGSKSGADSSAGLSLRSFLSKKSLLGKFSRSGSNLDHSPTAAAENAPSIGASGSMETDEGTVRRGAPADGGMTPSAASPSPFVVGKSKINEFYDKLSMNKAKYSLIKAKKLDIRNMLGGVTLGGREGSGREPKLTEAQQSNAGECAPDFSAARDDEEEAAGDTLADTLERSDERSSPSQHPEPLEVSVIDMDPSDAYEFSFDESFPKSDDLIPGMISEEDEEKENILDTTGASGVSGHGHGYGYDAYLNPPKPRTHRIGIGRIGRSSSENPRATARRYNLMEIGRSFSEMNDDDDSFAISECNNSCPNPSSLNTSSSINEHGSAGNLTRSVPVSPIPRTSSKLSIHQEQLVQHSTPGQLHQQHSLVEQSSHSRRRSTMLVKDSSLQSDSSRCSSVESLLNARKPDPEKILLNLGFGPAPHSTDVLAKIPKRFLKPSQVRGVDTEAFLRQQQLSMHIHENSVLGYRGLVGNPHIPPSMIVAKIMERFQENDSKTRLTASGLPLPQSDSRNSSGPPSPVPMTRHASLATADGRLKF